MKIRVVGLVMVVGLLVSIGRVEAQRGDGIPVLEAASIFTDAVTVVGTEPTLNFVDKQLFYLGADATSWVSVPLPAELEYAATASKRTDGTYLIGVDSPRYAGQIPNIRIFDPKTASLNVPDVACGGVKALPGEGRWIVYVANKGAPYVFCFTENGAVSPQMPDRESAVNCRKDFNEGGPSVTSPDGKYVLAALCLDEYNAALYSYDMAANQPNRLGQLRLPGSGSRRATLQLERWIDAAHPVISVQQPPSDDNRFSRVPVDTLKDRVSALYYVDLGTPAGLKPIVIADGGLKQGQRLAVFAEQPARYRWIEKTETACSLKEFRLSTAAITARPFPIAGLCSLGMAIPDGSNDRLDTNTLGELVRFNFDAPKAETLYASPTRQLGVVSLSPTGRYAELAEGNYSYLVTESFKGNIRAANDSAMLILDLQSQKVLLKVPYYISDPIVAPLLAPMLTWQGDQSFALGGGTIYEGGLGQITADGVKMTTFQGFAQGNSIAFVSSPTYALVRNDPVAKTTTPLVLLLKDGCCIRSKSYKLVASGNAIASGEGDIRIGIHALLDDGRRFALRAWIVRLKK